MSEAVRRWSGMALCAIGLISTLVLALNGDLTLYIHPRYVVFTVLLSVVGAVLFLAALWYSAVGARGRHHDDHDHHHDHHHDHDHDHDVLPVKGGLRGRVAALGVGAVVVVAAVALVLVPPATLSAERASSSASDGVAGGEVPPTVLIGSDPARFSVRDWAAILNSGATANDLVGQQADITGFLLVDDDTGSARVGRYAVTCCTVDAQLFAVPVTADALPAGAVPGEWVRVVGTFADDDGTTRLAPTAFEEVEEPDDPYLS